MLNVDKLTLRCFAENIMSYRPINQYSINPVLNHILTFYEEAKNH